MGKVITINKKIEFDSNINEHVKAATIVEINNTKQNIDTKIIPLNKKVNEYKVFKMQFYKKFNIEGNVFGKDFDSILRKYENEVLVDDNKKFVLTIGNIKGIIPRAAFKRLRKDTKVKCSEINVDLIKAIPEILKEIPDITINSGWFSELGTQLRNALLQGEEVNQNDDWNKFATTTGSKLKNVQFKINDDDFDGSFILISLSSRGFIFTNKSISYEKYLEIVDNIISAIDKPGILIYEGAEKDYCGFKVYDEEDEEDDIIKVDEIELEAEFTEATKYV